jgi:hypothetical protein
MLAKLRNAVVPVKNVISRSIVNCAGLEKPTVLAALHDNASPRGATIFDYKPERMTQQDAEYLLSSNSRFDAVNGRQLNVDFSQYPLVDETEFDEMYGEGKLESIVYNLRRGVRTLVLHEIGATKNHHEIIPVVTKVNTRVTYVKGSRVNYELRKQHM